MDVFGHSVEQLFYGHSFPFLCVNIACIEIQLFYGVCSNMFSCRWFVRNSSMCLSVHVSSVMLAFAERKYMFTYLLTYMTRSVSAAPV